MVVLISRRNGTFRISLAPEASRVEMKTGSAAFFEPLTLTSPESFLPPLMTSLSKLLPLDSCLCRGGLRPPRAHAMRP
jgi:hypothetical protein